MNTEPVLILPAVAGKSLLNSSSTNWFVKPSSPGENISETGSAYSGKGYTPDDHWTPAILPGTLLNTLLHSHDWVRDNVINNPPPGFFDPYFDNNITQIPDIYNGFTDPADGIRFYTYWYYTSFQLTPGENDTVYWLNFRGINYSADVFVNGVQLNKVPMRGAFLRYSFNLSDCPSIDGITRVAVRVVPPDPAGRNTGTNGGGVDQYNIGHNVTYRYPTGWDWIPAIPDRSTGIWDQVSLTATKAVVLKYPQVKTTVLDKNGKLMDTASISISVEVHNTSSAPVSGYVVYEMNGEKIIRSYDCPGNGMITNDLMLTVENPKLWWPNSSDPAGQQAMPYLYDLAITAFTGGNETGGGVLTDGQTLKVGIREITADKTIQVNVNGQQVQSRQFCVNGVPVFIKGGNWVGTDAMFRYGAERYRDEVRMHREMNLNMIRVWGGGIAERPEFYDACDEMGIMVMQDFWFSSEFEFSGNPPTQYSDAFDACAKDTIRLLRNHPSLLFWCGANESEPPYNLEQLLNSYVGPGGQLDDTRILVTNSLNISGNIYFGDGPYGLQQLTDYFSNVVNPLNPECGAVGFPVGESMRTMMSTETLQDIPSRNAVVANVNKVFKLHTFSSYMTFNGPTPNYDDQLYIYAAPEVNQLKTIEEYSDLAQLANYFHDKAMWEGVLSMMWTSYTGFSIWKTQNPWAGLRSAVYDWYLEQTGAYWGVKHACEPVHLLLKLSAYPATTYDVMVVNQTFDNLSQLRLEWQVYGLQGMLDKESTEIDASKCPKASTVNTVYTINLQNAFSKMGEDKNVYFVFLTLLSGNETLSTNFYWLSRNNTFNELSAYPAVPAKLKLSATGEVVNGECKIIVTAENLSSVVSFWNRLQVTKPAAAGERGERILPVFYNNNYFSLAGNESMTIHIDCRAMEGEYPQLWLKGLHQEWTAIEVQWGK
ncbi:MAG: hypothetical protein JNM19_03665 [Chitinophagaceae bacterium]|nr:hypothetical protein [Chitinophagaceae bacterium]